MAEGYSQWSIRIADYHILDEGFGESDQAPVAFAGRGSLLCLNPR
jgi:hypothetical protein